MKLPKSFYSWTTALGAALASVTLLLILFLVFISVVFHVGGDYVGLFTYIILPVFLIIGLVMIPVGIVIKIRKDKKQEVSLEEKLPVVDFNDPNQRRVVFLFGISTVILLFLSAFGSYEAFQFTETTKFCGQLCHQVMSPEYTAYQHSAHARVGCVDCHVGHGADWYVKSKLSGLYQVYSVIFKKYPKPIETPISNLRPARETCEECHWPEKFYSRQLVVNKHFLPDEQNTEWDISLQMKTGPLQNGSGLTEGIHWHINPNVKIEYASDPSRENISWVKYTNQKTGETKIFTENGVSEESSGFDTLPHRTMDCMDCHNRPSHTYETPMTFVNQAMASGAIPKALPDIKSLAMETLSPTFPTTDSAMKYIQLNVEEYYKSSYEDIYKNHKSLIDSAILGLQTEFKKNVFPEMKVTASAYPNHIGHLEFNGCFRCHNDQHSTANGEVITKDCNLCHTIVAQGVSDTLKGTSFFTGQEFIHPEDPDQAWKELACVECHKELYN